MAGIGLKALHRGTICLAALACPAAAPALTIVYTGVVTSVPSDADLAAYYYAYNDPPADPADYLFDRPEIGTRATVTFSIGRDILDEPLDIGAGSWTSPVYRGHLVATATVDSYLSSAVTPSVFYGYENRAGRFSFSSDDGTTYLRPRPPAYSEGADGSIDVIEVLYPPSGLAPTSLRELAALIRQPSAKGHYAADLGDFPRPLYVGIDFASPRVVPLPATVWLGLGGIAALVLAARRASAA